MDEFLATISSYPTMIYTVLLGIVIVYWVLALIGMVDIEGLDIDIDTDANPDGVTGLSGMLLAQGLNGTPFSIVLSLLVMLSWLFCSLTSRWFLHLFPGIWHSVAGTVILLLSLVIAIPITARILRPMRKLFITHNAVHNRDLVGKQCKVMTMSVDESFGQAFVEDGGSGLHVKICAKIPNSLTKNDQVMIVAYDQQTERYEVAETVKILE